MWARGSVESIQLEEAELSVPEVMRKKRDGHR